MLNLQFPVRGARSEPFTVFTLNTLPFPTVLLAKVAFHVLFLKCIAVLTHQL